MRFPGHQQSILGTGASGVRDDRCILGIVNGWRVWTQLKRVGCQAALRLPYSKTIPSRLMTSARTCGFKYWRGMPVHMKLFGSAAM